MDTAPLLPGEEGRCGEPGGLRPKAKTVVNGDLTITFTRGRVEISTNDALLHQDLEAARTAVDNQTVYVHRRS